METLDDEQVLDGAYYYHDRWQGELQPLLRQIPDEDGEVGADAAAEGKEEEDEDDDGDEEEGSADGGVGVRQVGLDVPVGPDVPGLDELGRHVNDIAFQMVIWAAFQMAWVRHHGAGYRGEEEVEGSHGCRAQCQDCARHNQQHFLTHQSGQDKVKGIKKSS